jgi:hypothetical protein
MIRKGTDFVEGFGDVTEKNGKVNFTNRAKLSFQKGLNFKKINCHD